MCVVIFLAGCLLEIIYCLMHRVSPFRILISGGVKTSGAVAAVFAVDANPSLTYVIVLFIWLFFWEIGGQNIPADWADIEEDRRLRAQTVPVRFGLKLRQHPGNFATIYQNIVRPFDGGINLKHLAQNVCKRQRSQKVNPAAQRHRDVRAQHQCKIKAAVIRKLPTA